MRTLVLLSLLAACAATGPRSDELARLYQEDQQEREGDWSGMGEAELLALIQRDEQRRERILELLAEDAVVTPADRYHAAMVLQHGREPEHYLLAHVLAAAAAFEGLEDGRWLSAAALDRYLQSMDRPQWFDTQFSKASADAAWTLEPREDRLPAAVRAVYGARTPEETRAKLDELNRR